MHEPLPKLVIASVLLATVLFGCSTVGSVSNSVSNSVNNSLRNSAEDLPNGMVSIKSSSSVDEVISSLREALTANAAITALPVIDHQANAAKNNLLLRSTSVQLFGNPALGTPLMQNNQMAGLDLPQKILVWEDEEGTINLAYNSVDYLRKRHALKGNGSESSLARIETALNKLTKKASGDVVADGETNLGESTSVKPGDGIVKVVSSRDMNTTYDTLVASIQKNQALTLMAEVNHTANAEGVGMNLNPTRLIIFGNPNLGTPLMQARQTVAIELPQKMLVFENAEGVVTIAYNDPTYLSKRHAITEQSERLSKISGALANLAITAAGI